MAAKTPRRATATTPPKPKKDKKSSKAVVPKVDDYLRELRAMKGVEKEDFAMFSDELAWVSPIEEWLPSGLLAYDRLTGGGNPVGRIIEMAAWESIGKSTILDQMIAYAQQQGAVTSLIDSEQARDKPYTERLGVDTDKLIVQKAETIEDAFIGIDKLLSVQEAHIKSLEKSNRKPPIMLIGWDSLGGMPTRGELKGDADDHHVSEAARNIKMNMRRIAHRIAKCRAVLVFTNHFYQQIGQRGLKTYGGSGVRYFASIRIWLNRAQNATLKVGPNVVGHIIEAKLKKTRVTRPRPPAYLGLIYGAGVHNAWTLFKWGLTKGVPEQPQHRWISQAGQWSYVHLPDATYEGFAQSFIGFAEVLANRPDIYQMMAAQYMAESADAAIWAEGDEGDD